MNPAFGSVLLVGGSSDIGAAFVQEWAAQVGAGSVVLAGRPGERRSLVADAVRGRNPATAIDGSEVEVAEIDWDAMHWTDPEKLMRAAQDLAATRIDLVVVAVGALHRRSDVGDAGAADRLLDELTVNLTAPAGVMVAAVRSLADSGGGRVVVLSSASAVRPRRSIAAYSIAKQALDALALDAAPDARRLGVSVHVVRPGHVRTAMTAGLTEPPFATDPQQVAVAAVRGVLAGQEVVWTPGVLRAVMAVLRRVPTPILPASLR